jgi:predicted O-methyltransferase YrrM
MQMVGGYDLRILRESAKWLVRSREHTNLTYDLTDLNMGQLAWFVSNVTKRPVDEIRRYMDELLTSEELASHVKARTIASERRGLADPVPRYGRRLGWYALVRALEPELVIETGTDKGLGAVVLADALLRNGHGRLMTIDVNPAAGYLVSGRWAEVTDYVQGNSHDVLRRIREPIDIFIHDSLHTAAHERGEYECIRPRLTDRSLVLSDNADRAPTLMEWAEREGLIFEFFREVPLNHWWEGGGIGAAHK